MVSRRKPRLAFLLVASATAIGIAGTDLVLPAIPSLPLDLGGTPEQAQLVLAAFTAGAAAGLLLFGELGARHDQRRLLLASMGAYAAASLACALSASLPMLILLRLVQGAAGSAAAVFAPGMLRAAYGDDRAIRVLGALASIEALAPALAPIAGTGLLMLGGWRASFGTLAALALALAAAIGWRMEFLPVPAVVRRHGGYRTLIGSRAFIAHGLGYAFTLGGLLVFVFGAPSVFVNSLGLDLGAFVALQCSGILCFAVAANLAGRLSELLGPIRLIWMGSLVSAAGAAALLGYSLSGGTRLAVVIGLFTLLNLGLGLRGAPGFHAALQAADGEDARASALIVLAVLAAAALGTAATAPFIGTGLAAIAAGSTLFAFLGLAALAAAPRAAPGA
jgi:MFS transporter, DHA1 family, multidrug resistance protein